MNLVSNPPSIIREKEDTNTNTTRTKRLLRTVKMMAYVTEKNKKPLNKKTV